MSSRYVMANIEMPIEITANNEICPLQNLSSIHVVSIIDSISNLNRDINQNDIISQANKLFKEREDQESSDAKETEQIQEEQESVEEEEPIAVSSPQTIPQLFIYPEEIKRTIPHIKQNSSLKKRSKYNPRTTVKNR
tara:strand:- start:985 stop:1395 length:411 start_codon:yes stop_codon:yes gene_type:complete